MGVFPDFGAVSGRGRLEQIVGALLTYGLIAAVLMVIVCGSIWALASSHGSWQSAARAKTGLFVALAGAVLIGSAPAWTDWLIEVGARL